jgi:hypothetical protein
MRRGRWTLNTPACEREKVLTLRESAHNEHERAMFQIARALDAQAAASNRQAEQQGRLADTIGSIFWYVVVIGIAWFVWRAIGL